MPKTLKKIGRLMRTEIAAASSAGPITTGRLAPGRMSRTVALMRAG
jgi:hypothetical protein